jgi:hypothetical protein
MMKGLSLKIISLIHKNKTKKQFSKTKKKFKGYLIADFQDFNTIHQNQFFSIFLNSNKRRISFCR